MEKVYKDQRQTENDGSQGGWERRSQITRALSVICQQGEIMHACITRTIENYFLKRQIALSMQIIYARGNPEIVFTWFWYAFEKNWIERKLF